MQSSTSISAADYQNCASLGRGETARYGANGREPARPAHQYQLTSKTATGSANRALQSGCLYCYVRPVRQNNAPLLRGRIDMAETTERWPSQYIKEQLWLANRSSVADSVNVTSIALFQNNAPIIARGRRYGALSWPASSWRAPCTQEMINAGVASGKEKRKMAGTKAGAAKAAAKLKARDPDFYKNIGRRGGQNGHTGGFASDVVGADGLTGLQRAAIAGAKGGRISKRGPAKKINVRVVNGRETVVEC